MITPYELPEMEWSGVAPAPTPPLYKPVKKANELHSHEGHQWACYLCALVTNCRLTMYPLDRDPVQIPVCMSCALTHGLWVRPPVPKSPE